MKKIFITTVTLLLAIVGLQAANKATTSVNEQPFIFNEAGIEFAVFKDGQFDFNVLRPSVGVNINTRFLDFSFNSGHNYDAFVQYDEYGAPIQIENTPIFYDYYGRVNRIGNVHLYYNGGLLSQIGNMQIAYTPNGFINGTRGYINNYNVNFVYQPYHRVYRRPIATRVLVYNRPYRRNFAPVRYNYVTYRRNFTNRRNTRVARNFRRPGKTVIVNNRRQAPNRVVVNNRGGNNRNVLANRNANTNRKVVTNRNVNNKRNVINNRNVVNNRVRTTNTRVTKRPSTVNRKATVNRTTNRTNGTNRNVATRQNTSNNKRANTNNVRSNSNTKKQYANRSASSSRAKSTRSVASTSNNKTYRRR